MRTFDEHRGKMGTKCEIEAKLNNNCVICLMEAITTIVIVTWGRVSGGQSGPTL